MVLFSFAGEEVGGEGLLVVLEKPNFSFSDEGANLDANSWVLVIL